VASRPALYVGKPCERAVFRIPPSLRVTHIRTLCLFGPDLGVHERLLCRASTEKHICANYARHRHSSAGGVHTLSAEHFERRADRRPQTSASCLVRASPESARRM